MDKLSINSQWKVFVRHCAQHAKQGVVAELDCGLTVCWTQTNWTSLNSFFLSSVVSDEADLRRRLEGMKTYVIKEQPSFPWAFFIEPELLPENLRERSREICLEADFSHIDNYQCMQATQLLPPVRPLPDAEIKFAASQQDVYEAVLLNVQAFDMDTSIAQNVMEHRALIADLDRHFCCIVLVDDKPVATATTVLLDECLYVALVATSAQYRRYGYAELAMRTSIERALQISLSTKHNIVLHASELGRPVYVRMGFKDISHGEIYVYKSLAH